MADRPIKAVVFDMDGVLIDATEWHYESLNRALAIFGFAISRYDHLVTYNGLPTRKKLEMLSREGGLPLGLHKFINEIKQQYTQEIVHAKCRPIFQHEFALSRLRSEGYRLGVASNSVRESVSLMMSKSNLAPYLDVQLSNEDVVKAKPDPEIYCRACELLEVAPQECVVVEDNEKGIKAAKDAGTYVLQVSSVFDVHYDCIKEFITRTERA